MYHTLYLEWVHVFMYDWAADIVVPYIFTKHGFKGHLFLKEVCGVVDTVQSECTCRTEENYFPNFSKPMTIIA